MRKSPLRSLFSHPGLALGGTFLALLGATGIAFSSWSTLQGARLEGIQAEFASVLDVREYVYVPDEEGYGYSCTPYSNVGFLGENDKIVYEGSFSFAFQVRTEDGVLLSVYPDGIPVSLTLEHSSDFSTAFPNALAGISVEGATGLSAEGGRCSFLVTPPSSGNAKVTLSMPLVAADAYRSSSSFVTAANSLESVSVTLSIGGAS